MSAAVRTDLARTRSRNPGANRSIWASISRRRPPHCPTARGSTPTGCAGPRCPAGVDHAGLGHQQYGRSGIRPAVTSASLRPPRPACRPGARCRLPASRAVHGTGRSARVHLADTGAVPEPAQCGLIPPGQPVARSAISCPESRRAARPGRRQLAQRPYPAAGFHLTAQLASSASSARQRALPPSTTGQPPCAPPS